MNKTVFLTLFIFNVTLAFGQISSDLSIDADGWTVSGASGSIVYNNAGGNPGGCVRGVDNFAVSGAPIIFFFNAPSKFLGNQSIYYNGNLSFDLQQGVSRPAVQAADVILSAGTTTIYYFNISPSYPAVQPGWTSYTISLNELSGNWKTGNSSTAATATQADIQFVLSNLISFQIRGRYGNSSLSYGSLDNVRMQRFFINLQPTSQSVCAGTSAILTSTATGNSSITYQWQKLSPVVVAVIYNNVTDGSLYTGSTTPTLSINTSVAGAAGTYRCVVSGSGAANIISSSVVVSVNALPAAPSASGSSGCSGTTFVMNASGGASGQYRWYTVPVGGTAMSGETNSIFTTPSLTATTTYYVAINNGTCESNRTSVTATVLTPPAPTVTGSSGCTGSGVTLNASGGSAGQYRWYTVPVGGTALSGETSSIYTTPSLAATTTYYVAINNGTCESSRTSVTATVLTQSAPLVTGSSGCTGSSVSLSASGGISGQYRWYTLPVGGTALAGVTSSNYTTPSLTTTTTYYVSLNNGTCESSRTAVTATINPIPTAPIVTPVNGCSPASVSLGASGGGAGEYRWYTVATGGTAIAGEVNATYVTPVISTPTTYYVSINNGFCESTRVAVLANVKTCAVNNPPVITQKTEATQIEGKVVFDLKLLLSDPDNNLDLAKLRIVKQPDSGAKASIDANQNLTLEYKNLSFSGIDKVTIEVCDLSGSCTQQVLTIEVVGDVKVYNAISPNGDGLNEIFLIQYITSLPDTKNNKVTIYNRWGDVVWEGTNYDNTTVVFRGLNKNGHELPSGTYLYKIEFASGRKAITDYLVLKK